MATIITKNSQTASAVPSAASLSVGELAVNTADGKLYTEHTGGVVKEIIPSTVVDGGITTAKIADGAITSAKIADGTIATADLANSSVTVAKISATGTPSSSTFLRGDGSWQTAGGGVTSFNGNTGAIEGMQRVASGSFSGASTITVTGLPSGYQAFKFVFSSQTGSSGGSTIFGLRISNNNGSSYLTSNYQITGAEASQGGSVGGFYSSVNRSSCEILGPNLPIGPFSTFAGEVMIYQKPTTDNTSIVLFDVSTSTGQGTSLTNFSKATGQVFAETNYYVNAIQMVRPSGAVALTGTYTVYGVRA